jgi:transketolase
MNRRQQDLMGESRSIELDERSKELRKLVMRGFSHSGKGHVGSALSLLEILRVLYDDILSYRSDEPDWKERDRLIVSPGWASIGLYAILADKGFFPKEKLDSFLDTHSMLGGCLDVLVPGVEATTGSCGHGLSIGIGMAISAKLKKKNQRVFVVIGDGEHGEGSIWEGAICASRHKLDNLCIIVDYNKIQCSGRTCELTDLDPLDEKWKSFKMKVQEVNGHKIGQLKKVFNEVPFTKNHPSVVICHTVKSKGIKFAENTADWHWKGNITKQVSADMIKSIECI